MKRRLAQSARKLRPLDRLTVGDEAVFSAKLNQARMTYCQGQPKLPRACWDLVKRPTLSRFSLGSRSTRHSLGSRASLGLKGDAEFSTYRIRRIVHGSSITPSPPQMKSHDCSPSRCCSPQSATVPAMIRMLGKGVRGCLCFLLQTNLFGGICRICLYGYMGVDMPQSRANLSGTLQKRGRAGNPP